MTKTIRILAIAAAALVGLSLLLLLISIPLQPWLASMLFGTPEDMLSALPKFPVIPFLDCFLQLGCVALLIICCGNKKGGIWLELAVFGVLTLVLPGIRLIAQGIFDSIINAYGMYDSYGYSIASGIAGYCTMPADLGLAIAYAACGMSIAFKHMAKKMRRPRPQPQQPQPQVKN